jgi:hypothetical protein
VQRVAASTGLPAEAVRADWRALHFVGAADCEAQMRAGGWI